MTDVILTDEEWEDMVNQQECLNADIADLKNENQTLRNCVFHLQEALKSLNCTLTDD